MLQNIINDAAVNYWLFLNISNMFFVLHFKEIGHYVAINKNKYTPFITLPSIHSFDAYMHST